MAKKLDGSIHVYTGEGKGKTTAAFGLAMRASGRGLKVLIIQFMKGRPDSGEVVSAKRLPNVKVEQYGTKALVVEGKVPEKVKRLAMKGLERARKAIHDEEVDMLILDEVNVAVHFGLVPPEQLLELVASKPADMELILTGRHARPEVVRLAEYVTEMKAKKHPYSSGRQARIGIEE